MFCTKGSFDGVEPARITIFTPFHTFVPGRIRIMFPTGNPRFKMMCWLLTVLLFTGKQRHDISGVIVHMRNLFNAFDFHVRNEGIINFSAIRTFEIG
jgi:hypothetical protein